jgi:flagellar FliL protein
MPAIRNEILLLLSSKQAEEVSSREGKEQLAKEIVVASNKILETTPATNTIERVNFTHLIIQ